MYTVYLAGAINGKSYAEATEWRDRVGEELTFCGYRVLDPMRFKSFLSDADNICDAELPIPSAHIVNRDLKDILESDAIIANMQGLGELPMIGTLIELGVALKQGTEVILFNVPDTYLSHPFLSKFKCAKNEKKAIARLREAFEL